MVQPETRNNEILKITGQVTNLNPYEAKMPTKLNDTVQAVFPVGFQGKFCDIVRDSITTNATTSTAYTTPTDRDFYLTAAALNVIKDVTSTSTASRLLVNISGSLRTILEITGITLTVQQEVTSISFPFPIKLDRGTTITVTNSTNVANCSSKGIIYGFTYQQDITALGDGNK
jgi:hypothetical protein